eukprot:1136619-Pelagomonas_calceolata.AAC.1
MQWRCCRAFLCSPAAMPSMQPAAFAWMYFFFEKMKLHYVTAGAILENAVITGTNFAGADLTGVNFEDVLGYFEAGWPCQCCCAGLPSALIILCKDVCRFRSEKNAAHEEREYLPDGLCFLLPLLEKVKRLKSADRAVEANPTGMPQRAVSPLQRAQKQRPMVKVATCNLLWKSAQNGYNGVLPSARYFKGGLQGVGLQPENLADRLL